ncbi:MAG TPA: nucleotidyltransferase family protein [Candidatus Acidoferrum sp.]|nr:nucleotidyltransferase family protein [Candidatus Acidoferrum sp.]
MAESTSPFDPADTTSFANEWLALLECASSAHDRERLAGLLRSADWARLLVLAEEHGVAGHLAACLRGLEEDLVPLEIKQTLIDRQRAQAFFTLRLTAELFRILDRFTSEGIGALVVKGPVLAMQAYGDPAMRSYGDLDLLVRQRDIRRATELMSAAGFAAAVPLSAIDAGKIPGQYLFSKPDLKLIVELHNDLTLRYFPRRLPLEEFFARQIRVRIDAREALALSVEDELVLICIHGAKHFWERLMWIADVAALVSRQTGIDWERVADSARAVGAERMLRTGLLLAGDLLKAQLPERAQVMVQADVVAARLAEQICTWLPAAGYSPPGLFERAAFRLRMRGNLIAAPAYLLRLSFSPTEEDWKEGGEGSPHKFLDMVRRPFRLARKYGRDNKS